MRVPVGPRAGIELHVVDMISAGEQADLRGRTYASIYSPANAKYDLQSGQTFATLRGEQGAYGAQETTKAVIEQKANSFRAQISVPVWVNQMYVSDWWRQSPAPLNVTVTERGNQWEVKVENRADRKVTEAKVVVEGKIFDLGEVPAKQTKTFSVDRTARRHDSGRSAPSTGPARPTVGLPIRGRVDH